MKSAIKIASAQYNFETDAGAVLYGSGKLSTALDNAGGENISKFGKFLLSANEKDFKRLLEISENPFRDECGNIWDGQANLSTAQKKFGTSSLRIDGNSISTVGIEFGGDPFTISFWCRSDSAIPSGGAYVFRAMGTSRSFCVRASNLSGTAFAYFNFGYGTTAANSTMITNVTTSMRANTWHHLERDFVQFYKADHCPRAAKVDFRYAGLLYRRLQNS